MENCGDIRSSGYIYIYIYIDYVQYLTKNTLSFYKKKVTLLT